MVGGKLGENGDMQKNCEEWKNGEERKKRRY
jgi:hypothetical protein